MAGPFDPYNDDQTNSLLSQWRAPILNDPARRDRLMRYARAEVGGQGPQAQQAFMEAMTNMAGSRGAFLPFSYFPAVTHQRAARPLTDAERAQYGPIADAVAGGSNISNYATGNASGTVGFAGGPQTYSAGGERFGVEGPDRNWWQKLGLEGPKALADGGDMRATAQLTQGKTNMPGLMDMFSPQDITGQPANWNDAIRARQSSLVGMGLGLMGGGWLGGMKGYEQGAATDVAAERAALERQMMNRPPEAIRQLQAMGIDPRSAQAKELLFPRAQGQFVQIGSDIWGNPLHGFVNPNDRTVTPYDPRTGTLGAPRSFGGGAVAPPAAVPFTTTGGAAVPGPAVALEPSQPIRPSAFPQGVAETEAYLRAHPEIDPKEYRKERTKMIVQKAGAEEQTQKSASNVIDTIDRAAAIATGATGANLPTTGMGGALTRNIPGTEAHNLSNLIDTIKANAAFDRLQEMRNASPTGGALGQVSNQEEQMLSKSIASLEQSQSQEQFLRNLGVVKKNYYDIIHGPGQYERAYGRPAVPAATSTAPTTGKRIDRAKAKAAGYSDAEIDAFERR